MKKLFFTVLCTSLAFAGFAQNDAKTLFESGKAKMSKFDELKIKAQIGQPFDSAAYCSGLFEGYQDLLKALPLDTIPETEKDGSPKIDKKTGKQKVKTKYSKEIISLIANHTSDFQNVGNVYYAQKDYANAAKAWETFISFNDASYLGKQKPSLADSTLADFNYNIGYMYYMTKDSKKSFNGFANAIKKGYDKPEVFDLLKYQSQFIVSDFIDKKDYDGANKFLDAATADFPKVGLFWVFKGIVVESKDNIDAALPIYQKAAEVDPDLSLAQFHVGRYYTNKAINLMNSDENMNLNDEELSKIINPYCEQALPYLKKAVELDKENNNPDAQRLLRWVEDRLSK